MNIRQTIIEYVREKGQTQVLEMLDALGIPVDVGYKEAFALAEMGVFKRMQNPAWSVALVREPRHPFQGTKKKRLRFGTPDTINVLLCEATGQEIHEVKNWHGGTPRGAVICSHCGKQYPIGGG